MNFFLIVYLGFLLAGCQMTPVIKVVTPNQIIHRPVWTEQDKQQNISLRHLERNEHSSTHIIWLRGQEKPHYHDKHDLSVVILSGQSVIHFKDQKVNLSVGDVILIPKGTYHWAENTSEHGSEVYAIFSPPFDGKDRRLAK